MVVLNIFADVQLNILQYGDFQNKSGPEFWTNPDFEW